MSHNAKIIETQMPMKRRKKGMLKKMHEVLNRSPLSSEPGPLGSQYMATEDMIVSATTVVGVRTPSLCSFYHSLNLFLACCRKPPHTAMSRSVPHNPHRERERENIEETWEEKEGIGNKKERKKKGKVTKRKKVAIHNPCTPTIFMSPSTRRL
jgi:hypothetical protein